ncbi:NADH-cytochrome b5 reductase 1 [Schistosoma japonicum]|uniref:NADH-cytochrome b5 reductase n=1 Tax=Schistosoma japonicum TaxID=6182 RepID=C1LDT3_SCHJA|nr:NADH-cytochrome b5 reductase 1 [Schistosoma japonicum]CAX72861.1 cytochrome b5 reductase 1 [Schistosoma japonicum]
MAQNTTVIIAVVASVTAVVAVSGVVLGLIFRSKKPKKTLVDNDTKIPLRVVDRSFITHDTIRLKLGLPTADHILGLPVGNHVFFSAKINGSLVVRPYTPITLDNQKGYVDFVIKVYKSNVNPKFPKGGLMSQYVANLPINGFIDVRGPSGKIEYKGCGLFHIKQDLRSPPNPVKVKRVNMICGGSGITPMFQLLSYILQSKDDTTQIAMVFANVSEKDIILRDELENLRDKYPDHFRLWYTVSEAPERWTYSTGYVNEQILQEHIYPSSNDTITLICGPPPFIEFACYSSLNKLNYAKNMIYTF